MTHDPRFTKEAIERRTFEALAPLIGWQILADSVRQPGPPHPDITCEVVGSGLVAVELVSLDDGSTRRRLANMFSTPAAWTMALERRPVVEQRALQSDLSTTYISANFDEHAGPADRAAAFHLLQTYLLAHRGRRGEVTAEDIGLPKGFHGVRLGRDLITNGPRVTSSSGGYWQAPQVGNIASHLQKRYEIAAPLDLFAYSTHDDPDGHINSLANVQAAVAQHLPGSQFRRVHVFHVGLRQHIWSSQ